MRANFALVLICALPGCIDVPEGSAPETFHGVPGARFFAVAGDEATAVRRELTADKETVSYETSAEVLQLSKLPVQKMRAGCAEKLSERGFVKVAALVDPVSGAGAMWSSDGKIMWKRELVVETTFRTEDRGTAGDGIVVGGRVGIVQRLTLEQFKTALRWFAEDPCASYEGA